MTTTREKILKAGLGLFSERGYLGATTREIAKTAGVAEMTLFRYFPKKELLFKEVISSYSFLPELKTLLQEVKGMPYDEALTVIACRFLQTLEKRKNLIRIMHTELHSYPDEIKRIYHAFIDDIFKLLAGYFEELQRQGILRGFSPETGARAFLGMFFSYFTSREFLMNRRINPKAEAVISGFTDIFISGTVKKAGAR